MLTITVAEGKLIRDTEMFGTMDPYCTITFKNQKFKTRIHNGGGKKPIWGDTFSIETTSPTEEIVLRCWDQDVTTSDPIGFVTIKLSSLMINCGVEDWFPIMFENKTAGEIFIKSKFEPKGGNLYEQEIQKVKESNEKNLKEAEEAKA